MKLPSLSQAIVSTGTFALAIGSAAVSAYLAKQVYHISVQLLKERTDCPGIELTCMTIVAVNAAYVSLKLGRFLIESKPLVIVTPRWIRPIRELVAFDPGEMVAPSPQNQQIAKDLREAYS